VFDTIQTLLKENPLIAGGASVALVGWLMVQAKTIPLKLLRMLQDQFSTTMTVYSEDGIFRRTDQWLSEHPSAKHSRRFGVAQWHNSRSDSEAFGLTPGQGFHLLREGLRFYLVHRHVEDKSTQEDFSKTRRQTISITTFGRSKTPLQNLLNSIKEVAEDHTTIPISLWAGYDYVRLGRRTKRQMDTVYTNAGVKEDLVADVQKFLSESQWYADRGIPYRRGYMLYGKPGTGKTTLIFALASLLERPVAIINPATIENDNQLQKAVNSAGNAILVIEDIDSIEAAEERVGKVKTAGPVAGVNGGPGITLSGLLNAIDGIGAQEGRLLFITSNHPDVLDAALIRPGRIDRQIHLDELSDAGAREMFTKFYPDREPDTFMQDLESALPIPAAALQNRLLGLTQAAA